MGSEDIAVLGAAKYKVKNTKIQYLLKYSSYEVGRPLILTAILTFLIVFHTLYTSQMLGKTQKFEKMVKTAQKRVKMQKSSISCTIDRIKLVDPSS